MTNWSTPKWILAVTIATVALAVPLYGFHVVEQFLIRDDRFTLNGPGSDSESLEVSGAAHFSPRLVEAVFGEDFGRSVYLIPLNDRRASLREMDWIKDANVARFWPNRLVVGVTERKPLAYVASGGGRTVPINMLIDEEGVLLKPGEDSFTLPLLKGVRASDPQPVRRERVQLFKKLTKDLGAAAGTITEADVSDPDDVKVSEPFGGRSVTLMLGDHNFGLRHQNFLNYYADIRKRMPTASVLDMRLEDRITVVQQ